MTIVNSRPFFRPAADARAAAPSRRANPRSGSSGFSLVELLIVTMVLGILASIAIPQILAARRIAAERAVTATLRTMVAEQQLFFLNPVPLPPSVVPDPDRRYARLHELNSWAHESFGDTVTILYVDAPRVRYSMVPLWPTTTSLRGRFVIQAAEQGQDNGFIYEVDESGRVVKIR
jgi:prepilin-type N-terminal cleavage/methylation domain-containing protein